MPAPLDRLTIGHFTMRNWTLKEDVRNLERLGFSSISLASTKVEAYGTTCALALLKRSDLKVAHFGSYGRFGTTSKSLAAGLTQVRRGIDWLHAIGGDVMVVISGGRAGASWEAAAAVYADAYATLLPEATAAGIKLAIEVIHPLRQDLCFINTLADGRRLARRAGRRGGYVLDVWHSGWERDLLSIVSADAARRIHAVQLSDYKPVTMRTLDRALLGRGILPLRDIVRHLEQGGYRGWYEIEIISDDLEAMGYEKALRHTRAAFARLFD